MDISSSSFLLEFGLVEVNIL
jgi:hypothetical protein